MRLGETLESDIRNPPSKGLKAVYSQPPGIALDETLTEIDAFESLASGRRGKSKKGTGNSLPPDKSMEFRGYDT